MPSPARQLETDYVRVAAANFDLSWTDEAEKQMRELGLNLLDVHDALLECEVKRSNKLEAEGAQFFAHGRVDDGRLIDVCVLIDHNEIVYRVERVALLQE